MSFNTKKRRDYNALLAIRDNCDLPNGVKEMTFTHLPCVYFLMSGGEIVYVGHSKCLVRRIGEHQKGCLLGRQKRILFDRVFYIPVDYWLTNPSGTPQHILVDFVRDREREFILQYLPRYNDTCFFKTQE